MANPDKVTYSYYHQRSGKTITLRPIILDQDLERLHEWTHYPHVIPNWQLNKSKVDLQQHFRNALSDTHQSLFMVAVDGREICYAETYYAPDDRLATFCELQAGDYGLHLFIGPPEELGKGHSDPILCALTDYLFSCCAARRVLVEPNQKVQQLTILERKLGFSNLGLVVLPEKTATLYAIDALEFYKHNPASDKIQSANNSIHCDASQWPLVRMHFPTSPQDEAVVHWLGEVDALLLRAERCVVISTFDENYQFSPSARRQQALWFKKNVERLAASCMAMLRVTSDKAMIEKITSNAMRQGMPFQCIPAQSVQEAEDIASRLLAEAKKLDKLETNYASK